MKKKLRNDAYSIARGVNLWDVSIKASNAACLDAAKKQFARFQQKRLGLQD